MEVILPWGTEFEVIESEPQLLLKTKNYDFDYIFSDDVSQ